MTTAIKPDQRKTPKPNIVKSDAPHVVTAKQVNKIIQIHALFGILDGVSLSNSMIKYFFDILNTNTDISTADVMHEWMVTPAGMFVVGLESISIVALSLMANVFSEQKSKDDSSFKKFIVSIWPYCRDAMKSLKNAYKGIRSTLLAFDSISDQNLSSMILPLGLVLGGISILNRMWLRSMRDERKKMMTSNNKLLKEIQDTDVIDKNVSEKFNARIKRQSPRLRYTGFASNFYSGVVDGMYLYMGVLSVVTLAPELLIAMTIISSIYVMLSIATRVYEEHDYQRELIITEAKIELALCGKELGKLFANLESLSLSLSEEKIAPHTESIVVGLQKDLMEDLESKMKEYEEKQKIADELIQLSGPSVWLAGLKNGLTAYGVVASFMFATATISSLLFAPVSPIFVIACVTSGLACLIGLLAYSIKTHNTYLQEPRPHRNTANAQLYELLTAVKSKIAEVQNLKPSPIKDTVDFSIVSKSISDGLVLDSSPQFIFQETFEVARSFFSGVNKGQKVVDFVLNSYQELGRDGHYHDSNIMIMFTIISAPIFATILALRAYARGFGRDKPNASEPGVSLLTEDKLKLQPEDISLKLSPEVVDLTVNNPFKSQPSSLTTVRGIVTNLGLFRSQEMERSCQFSADNARVNPSFGRAQG